MWSSVTCVNPDWIMRSPACCWRQVLQPQRLAMHAGPGPLVVAPPPSLNRHSTPRHQITPLPEARRDNEPSPMIRHEAEPAPLPPPASTPAPAIAAEPAPSDKATDIKGTLDKQLAAGDSQITGKLRDFVTAKQFGKHIAREPDRKAIEAFYAARGYAPLWISEGRLNPAPSRDRAPQGRSQRRARPARLPGAGIRQLHRAPRRWPTATSSSRIRS